MALKYQEVALNLADKIKAHEYDKKLPSEGKLMEEYSVSRNTIRNALNVLYNQGLLRRIQAAISSITRFIIRQTSSTWPTKTVCTT